MRMIDQGFSVLKFPSLDATRDIEVAGRTCYKSEDKISGKSADAFVARLRDSNHHAMIEFADATVRFTTNRGVTHELVRHRLCSFAQESTRYVNYGGDDIDFIKPVWWNDELWQAHIDKNSRFIGGKVLVFRPEEKEFPSNELYAMLTFFEACASSEAKYKQLLKWGWRPEQAREVLPNALKTEIVVKANFREWRHIFMLRCSKKAHPQIRALMRPVLAFFYAFCPPAFEDIHDQFLL